MSTLLAAFQPGSPIHSGIPIHGSSPAARSWSDVTQINAALVAQASWQVARKCPKVTVRPGRVEGGWRIGLDQMEHEIRQVTYVDELQRVAPRT